MNKTLSRTLTVAAAVAALAGGAAAATAATGQPTAAPRPAIKNVQPTTSDITQHGGAARLHGDRSKELRKAIDGRSAKNVILIIGDGMGDSEITVARNYQYGAAGRFPGLDALPLTGHYTTFALDKATGKPDYVTDSAASGSGWATGTKTYNNAISVDIKGKPQKTLLELAKAKGLRTGNVSTAELQDATPAVQASHVTARSCYGPVETTAKCPTNALENGGRGSITEQLIATRADVTLGGGAKSFNQVATAGKYKGKTLLEQATAEGYQVVTDRSQLNRVSKANQSKPVLGLFSQGNMPVDWQGPKATRTGGKEPAVRCADNPALTSKTPRLEDMTSKAISLLNKKNNEKGFFLQVESASIDKEDHAANPCGQIGETVQIDEAIQVALEFAKKDKNTLVVVTADHAHSSQIVYPGETTLGLTRTLTTNEGAPLTVAYGTSDEGGSQMHTGSQVRIAGYGPQAANVVGLSDQTDLFFTVQRALGLGAGGELR